MPSANVYDMAGAVLRQEQLDKYVFGAPVNTALLHQVVTAQLTNRRQGNADTKTRAEVSGGNKKPYRQKGTGRARQGSTRAPHFTGGGVVFGPQPHEYERKIPRKMKRLALRAALSDKARNGRILLVENFELEDAKTRVMRDFLATLPLERHVLILLPERDETLYRAAGNVHQAKLGNVASINVVDLLKYDHLLMPVASVEKIVTMFGEEADEALQMKRHPRVVLRRRASRAAAAPGTGTRAATSKSSATASATKPATASTTSTTGTATTGTTSATPTGKQNRPAGGKE
jgi:large subunit ribosomal protein L4